MKKLIAIVMMLLPILAWGQKVESNETDKFTGTHKIEISSELLYKKSNIVGVYALLDTKFIAHNDTIFMAAVIAFDKIVKYTDGNGVSFLLDNGNKINLTTLYTGIGAERYTAWAGPKISNIHSFTTVFRISKPELKELSEILITDVRVRYFDGHYDVEVKEKNAKKFQKAAKLILNELDNHQILLQNRRGLENMK